MKALMSLPLIVALFACPAAQAVTFNCQGQFTTKGTAQLRCNDTACVAIGTLTDENIVQPVSLANCMAVRRAESNASMYRTNAYYDVKSGPQCWANYIRVSKTIAADKTVHASFVSTIGGDQHDYSGYQYLYLSCQLAQ